MGQAIFLTDSGLESYVHVHVVSNGKVTAAG